MWSILDAFKGKTYIAALGLVCLAIYQATISDFSSALQSLLGALAAIGLRHAIAKVPEDLTVKVIDAHIDKVKKDIN